MLTDREAKLVAILTTIGSGARATGRWIDDITFTAIDSERDDAEQGDPPDGYYDADHPPEGLVLSDDDKEGCAALDEIDVAGLSYDDTQRIIYHGGGKFLYPAKWEPYTGEEQDAFLFDIADKCKDAMALFTEDELASVTNTTVGSA